jgi:hypothetical protein
MTPSAARGIMHLEQRSKAKSKEKRKDKGVNYFVINIVRNINQGRGIGLLRGKNNPRLYIYIPQHPQSQ